MRTLVILIAKLMGMHSDKETPRADMHLPNFVLALGIVCLAFAVIMAVRVMQEFSLPILIGAAALLILAIAAILCWKNQTIRVISDTQFEYTTFLGRTYTYNFSDITGIRENRDSLTLFVGGKKVHLEASAFVSDRLVELLNSAIDKLV